MAILLYVDDLLIAYEDAADTCTIRDSADSTGSTHPKEAAHPSEIKARLCEKYQMKDLGVATKFIGMEITYDNSTGAISLGQKAYIDEVARRFGLDNAKPAYTPMDQFVDLNNMKVEDQPFTSANDIRNYQSMVGSIMFAALGTRPDVSFAVGVLSRYNAHPLAMHVTAAKRVIRYLKTTSHLLSPYGCE